MSRDYLTDHVLCDPARAEELNDEQLPGVLLALLETLGSVLARVLERHPLEFPGSVPPSRRMLTIEQVAEELNIKTSTAGQLVKCYELTAYKIGRHLRVSRPDLERYKRANSTANERGKV